MKSENSIFGKGILFVFGLVFFLAGIVATYSTSGKMIVAYFASSDWQKVPVTITSLNLKQSSGDSSTVKAEYVYYFNGAQHQSDRVALSDGSDNLGSYWKDLYSKLKQDKANGRVSAWVDPNNPSNALLDRTFRWATVLFGLVFFIMFSGVGLLCMWAAVRASKSEEDVISEARVGGISCNEKSGYWFLFGFGSIFFFIGVIGFISALSSILNEGEYGALFILLFPIVGGAIMAFAFINQRRYKIIGPSPLFLDPLPGVIGGQIGGKFDVNTSSQNTPINIVLTCKKKVKSGKNTRVSLVWQESMKAYVEQTGKGVRARFLFDCPEDLPDSSSTSIFWEVRAEGTVTIQSKTVKLGRTWNIPVTDTQAVPSTIDIPAEFLQQQNEQKLEAAKADATDLMNLNQRGQYLEVESLSERPVGTALGGVLFGAIFAGVGVFTIKQDWWPGYIFVAVGALIIYASIFLLGRGIEVKVDTALRILYTRRSWFGFVLYKREVMLFDPSQFSVEETSSSSNNKDLIKYYKVQVKDNDKQVLVAEGIKGKGVAEAVMNGIIEKAFPARF